jgi:hypothetical protein
MMFVGVDVEEDWVELENWGVRYSGERVFKTEARSLIH